MTKSLRLHERRAKTHERFYMIEVHRHRFARYARKVPLKKCEHWRKVCGRSAKDQIASTLFHELVITWYEFSILKNATPMGPRKICERGVPGNFFFLHGSHICFSTAAFEVSYFLVIIVLYC